MGKLVLSVIICVFVVNLLMFADELVGFNG